MGEDRIGPELAEARRKVKESGVEVFEDTRLEAYLRAEHVDKAEETLHSRLKPRASVRASFLDPLL